MEYVSARLGGFLVIVVVGATVLSLLTGRRSTWKVLAGGLLGLSVVSLLIAVAVPSMRRAVGSRPWRAVRSGVPAQRGPDADVRPWSLHANWPADRYATRARAVEALAARIVRELRDGAAACSRVAVAAEGDAPHAGDLFNALRLRADNLTIAMVTDPDDGLGADAALLTATDQPANDVGTLAADLAYATINGDRATREFTVAYANAAWVLRDAVVDDPGAAVFVGRSAAEVTRAAAQAIAERQALQRLGETVRARLSARGMPRAARWALRADRLESLLKPIALANGWGFEPPFAQTLETAHGKLSRVAVRSAPVDVVRISNQLAQRVAEYRASWMTQGFAVLVLGGLTFLGYRVLDGGTQGHFTWKLRLMSLAAFVAATTVTLLVVA